MKKHLDPETKYVVMMRSAKFALWFGSLALAHQVVAELDNGFISGASCVMLMMIAYSVSKAIVTGNEAEKLSAPESGRGILSRLEEILSCLNQLSSLMKPGLSPYGFGKVLPGLALPGVSKAGQSARKRLCH